MDEDDLQDPTMQAVLGEVQSAGWRRLAPQEAGTDWVLLEHPAPDAAS
jgi:hypothetical protein